MGLLLPILYIPFILRTCNALGINQGLYISHLIERSLKKNDVWTHQAFLQFFRPLPKGEGKACLVGGIKKKNLAPALYPHPHQ